MLDYFAQHLWQMWAILAVVCLILELTAGDFFIICFSIGAVFACVADALGAGMYLQLGIFAACSLGSIFFVRPFALRFLHRGEEARVSNADALLGRKGFVVEAVKADGYGRVKIDGDVWKAVTNEPQDIPEGQTVRVVSRESTIITVETAVSKETANC